MKRWLLALASIVLVASFCGCAHTGGYASGGGAYFDDCVLDEDCYGGPQYTCVVYVPPAQMTTRMQLSLAERSHSTRILGPRGEPATAPSDSGSLTASPGTTAPSATSAPIISRGSVVVAAPAVDRGSPRVHN